MERALLIGYGNTLRSDDGVGPWVARRLAEHHGAAVIEAVQLLPEHIEMAARADRVVLVDAAADLQAGVLRCEQLVAGSGNGPLLGAHDLSPSGLVRAVAELYGAHPEVWLVSVGAASFELGEAFSPAVEAALPEIVAVVERLLERS
jgi:hydrogenase maturation protease